jgi:hypothetical protein
MRDIFTFKILIKLLIFEYNFFKIIRNYYLRIIVFFEKKEKIFISLNILLIYYIISYFLFYFFKEIIIKFTIYIKFI